MACANWDFVNHETSTAAKKFKLVFLGEQNVGKTNLITRFIYQSFVSRHQATIGIDILSTTIYIMGIPVPVKLDILDTSGSERFRSRLIPYIRNSSVAIIVYDVTNTNSFHQTSKWVKDVREELGKSVPIFIVGNHAEIDQDNPVQLRQVSPEEGERKARELDAIFIETSAKNGDNINLLFELVASVLPFGELDSNNNRKISGRHLVDFSLFQ